MVVTQYSDTPKKWTEAKTERFRYDLEEKRKFPRFPSFQFCPLPKIQISKFSEISFLLQILTVDVTQDLKTRKKWTETKTESSRYGLRTKNEHFQGFQVFGFCPITKIETRKSLKSFYLRFWHWL